MIRKDPLLVSYPIRIREITIFVILFLSFIFYLFPRFLDEGKITESFTPLNPEINVDPASIYKNYYTELSNNDPVKQAFILIIGLGGLYWLHQLMYPKKR